MTDNTLTLYLIDGARYDFARHRSAVSAQQRFFGSPSPGERDIFGRQHTEPSEGTEGTDIFGRDTSGATPDIFGRSRQDPPVSGDDDDEPEGGGGDGGGDGPP